MKPKRKLALVNTPVLQPAVTRAEKLAAAIQYLGPKWVLHPKFNRESLRIGLLTEWVAGLERYRP